MTSPTGSGSAAIARTPSAIALTRPSSSARRSSSAASSPFARPASMSRALASRISAVRASSAPAIACSAASLVPVGSAASAREASRAARHSSATEGAPAVVAATGGAVVAIDLLHQDEVIPVHGLVRGPGQDLAHLAALHAHDLAQLGGRVVGDALADDRRALSHVDGVARLEAAADV